ncbi:MAG TPA: jacalin-like lectin [Candidatus Dormibacteraeota bacterium]|nr:jacalin-like lectin [Candidatus Dormibacteraeota bacterium]
MAGERVAHSKRAEGENNTQAPTDSGRVEEFGPECGGAGGVPYSAFTYPPGRITKVSVWHRQYVDGIQLETEAGPLPRIGGTGKHRDVKVDSFELAADEIITGICVEYWTYVDRITFHTNKGHYGPFGGSGGRVTKTLEAPAGRRIAGFKGRHWELVDSIQLILA